MRKAAGVILMVLGVVALVPVIISVVNISDLDFASARLSVLIGTLPYGIVFGGLLVAGGVLCLKRRHWGVCLVSAVITVSLWIGPVVMMLVEGGFSALWNFAIQVPGGLVAIVFISLRKKEWEEFSDSVDCEVSDRG
jgi:hypothetical protein